MDGLQAEIARLSLDRSALVWPSTSTLSMPLLLLLLLLPSLHTARLLATRHLSAMNRIITTEKVPLSPLVKTLDLFSSGSVLDGA